MKFARTYFLVLLVFFFLKKTEAQDSIASKGSVTTAQIIINKNLILISDDLIINSAYGFKAWPSVFFIEYLSGIPSTSGGDYIGRHSPTFSDYTNWKNWYNKNRDSISWNGREIVFSDRKVEPPKQTAIIKFPKVSFDKRSN